MGKALVIKNVDFSTNKLATVDLEDDVPCTGITLSASTLSITKVGNTSTLTASVTPYDCTDSVVWTTSNANVATVAGGVVTATGVGTATITATCGTHSATCTVTATHVLTDSDLFVVNGYGAIGADLSADPPKNFVYEQANTKYREYLDTSVYTDNPTGKYRALADKGSTLLGYSQNAIEIPTGATQMTATVPTGVARFNFAWQDNSTESGYYTDRVAFASVTQWDANINVGDMSLYTVDLSELPEGTNSFVLTVNSSPSGGANATTFGNITITFS